MKMPLFVMIGETAVHLYEQKPDNPNLARYFREAGCWYINILRRPNGQLVACHEEPFPETIANEICSECTLEQYRKSNGLD
jgi:hypothetical protein